MNKKDIICKVENSDVLIKYCGNLFYIIYL